MADIPKVRFKGFSEGWERRRLKNEFSNFIVPMRDKPKEFGGEIPWTRIEDIEGKYLNGSLSGKYVTEDTVNKMNLKIIPKDSLIVSSSATFGVVAVVTQDLVTNQTFIGLVPNEKDTLDYWYVFFHSDETRKYMKLESAGSTIFYIARESFENMSIKVPKKEEKLKIGLYFDVLDHLITLHQHKCDETKELKKYMLQKMFPKNGKKIPEIRFAGFTGDWEERKLEEIAIEIVAGGDVDKNLLIESGNYPVIANALTNNGIIGYYENNYRIKAPAVTVTGRGDVGYAKARDVDFTPVVRLLTIKSEHDVYFLENAINTLKIVVESTGVPQLTVPQLSKYVVSFPKSIEEETKIGAYFSHLDHLITLHQCKCDELKEVKKFMLQNMFPQKG